ncbi:MULTISPECIES: hypothetical protein [unclassified Sphingomonas]|uniref:hypothetical protein n=1 Tax=unclassified Sphingomonas TaxID=196159 RepID=UPI000A4DB22F|nr:MULTISPECIES: hypothetical protein [unclassified Sphingomonas]
MTTLAWIFVAAFALATILGAACCWLLNFATELHFDDADGLSDAEAAELHHVRQED